MNRCLRCHTAIPVQDTGCPACGWEFSPTGAYIYGDSLTNDVTGVSGLGAWWALVIHPISLLMLVLLVLPTYDVWSLDPFLHRCFPGLGFLIVALYVSRLHELNHAYQLEPRGRTAMACLIAFFVPFVFAVIPSTFMAMLETQRISGNYLMIQGWIAVAWFVLVLFLRDVLLREQLITITHSDLPLQHWNAVPWADHAIRDLGEGRPARLRYRGHAMTGRIADGQLVHLHPITGDLHIGDAVLAMVGGQVYIHVVTDLRDQRVQIGTHHGRIIGWTPRGRVYGTVVGISG